MESLSTAAAYGVGFVVASWILYRMLPNPRLSGKEAQYWIRAPRFKPVYALLNEFALFVRKVFGRNVFSFRTDHLHRLIDEAKTDKLFGPQDELHRGLELFVKGASKFPLNFVGQLTLNGNPQKCLTARRQVVNYVNQHPHIAEIPIKAPIIVLGLPRTGSTLLYNLLAQDPATRAPYMFEMIQFIDPTPPTTKEGFATDPRIALVEQRFNFFNNVAYGVVDEMSASHPAKPFAPDEELIILFQQLIAQPFFIVAGPEYLEWVLKEGNKDFVYIYLKRFLQMMSSSFAPSSHWTLKSPFHAIMIDALLGQFPDARIVVTHRNLENVLPSFAKLLEAQTYAWAEDASVDRRDIGRTTMRCSKIMVERLESFRRTHTNPDQFFDVQYDELVKDPIAVVKKIYAHHGLKYTPEFEQRMRDYIADNPQGKHGRNKYSLESYAMTKEEIQREFADYTALRLAKK